MLAERRRALRALGDRSLSTFWLARLAERAGDWLFLLTILVAAWNLTRDASLAAWALAVWMTARLAVWGLFDGWTRRFAPRTWPLLIALRALAVAVVFVSFSMRVIADPDMLLVAAGAVGLLSAVATRARAAALAGRAGLGRLGSGAATDAFMDRVGLFVGALIAGLVLSASEPAVALAVAAVGMVVAASLAFAQLRNVTRWRGPTRSTAEVAVDAGREVARKSAVYLIVAFTAGSIGAVLMITTLRLWTGGGFASFGGDGAPLLVAAYGLGLLVGPLPAARLLLRVPAPLLLFSTVVAVTIIAILLVVADSAVVALPALLALGLVAVTQDSIRAIAFRRLVPSDRYERTAHLSLLALTVGQLYGAIGVVSLTGAADPFAILVVVAVTQVVLVGLGVLLAGRSSLQIGGLSSLPIKSVVHKLSWATRPPARAADLTAAGPRSRRLAKWINRTVELEELKVTLPLSGQKYTIFRPDEASREQLFEQGRADPEKQMPYWAKVWPSGVALADVVVERNGEVSNKHVLELGAGLGVTACAVLEYGGHLVTADYSALPLAHCRLNTLVNSGRAPEATCFNWRHDDEVTDVLEQPHFKNRFPLIIAGDVLYESRDAEPLLNVIERMLAANGSLWLAEPVRRTAQRFLDSAASLGWEIESRQVKAEWPDATEGPVNLHFLTRSADADALSADLGGWRI